MELNREVFEPFRCRFCNRLLARIGKAELLEIKCPKCKQLNLWGKKETENNGKEDRQVQ